MTKFRLRTVILSELAVILLISLVAGGFFSYVDFKRNWQEHFVRDQAVIRQIFLEHRNEILNGVTDPFENDLRKILNSYRIDRFDIHYATNGRSRSLHRDLTEQQQTPCSPMGLSALLSSRQVCFQTQFSWREMKGQQQDSEPLLSVHWWADAQFFRQQAHAAGFFALALFFLGIAISAIHWLIFDRFFLFPVTTMLKSFDAWVRREPRQTEDKEQGFGILEITDLTEKFSDLLLAAEKYQHEHDRNLRLEARHEISRQVAHDLRSPLTALKYCLENEHKSELLSSEIARSSVHRIAEIVATLSLKASPSVEAKGNGMDLSQLVNQVIQEFRVRLAKNPDIEISFSPGLTTILIDGQIGRELQRAVSNLIENSLEALPESGGQIAVTSAAANGQASIRVFDNGHGIPNEVLSRMGEHGFTSGKEDSPHSGSGLGVYHAKNTATQLGGQLTYKSEPGRWTLAEITWPIDRIPDAEHSRPSARAENELSPH